jgi:putative salt-induced outer membrane protein YdiY
MTPVEAAVAGSTVGGSVKSQKQSIKPVMKEQTIGRVCSLALGAGAFLGSNFLASAQDAAAAAPDPSLWKTSASAGVSLTRGNSETLMVNASILSEKKWAKNELSLGASATYGEDSDKVNASTLGGFGQYNRLFSDRFFGYLRIDANHDDIAKVDYRVTLSPGVGYYFIKDKKFTLSGEVGPSYVFERLDGDDRNYLTVRFGEKFTWQINDRARFWQTLDYSPKVDEWSDYVLNAEVGIETDITKHLGLRVAAIDSYRSRPAAHRKENDLKLIASAVYKF